MTADYSVEDAAMAGCGTDHETDPVCLSCGKRTAPAPPPDALIEAARREARLREAASLRRNVVIHDQHGFAGDWIAIPREDFDALRAALAEPTP